MKPDLGSMHYTMNIKVNGSIQIIGLFCHVLKTNMLVGIFLGDLGLE